MTQPIIEAYAEIRARAQELAAGTLARCPEAPSRTLYACLRNKAPCPPQCPYVNDWIGPEEGNKT